MLRKGEGEGGVTDLDRRDTAMPPRVATYRGLRKAGPHGRCGFDHDAGISRIKGDSEPRRVFARCDDAAVAEIHPE
jgi:hypothetical protein